VLKMEHAEHFTSNRKPRLLLQKSHRRLAPIYFFAIISLIPLMAECQPRVPTDGAEILERLPMRPTDASARTLAQLRAQVLVSAKENPTDPSAATRLAEHYFDLAMALGDPRYVGYADAVIKPFAQAKSAALLGMRGQLQQYRHHFQEALDDFDAALQLDPQFASANAWRGAVLLVQAKYPEAKKECAALLALGRTNLYGGCQGLALAYGGQMEPGFTLLKNTLDATEVAGNRLWLLTRMAEVAAWRGQARVAEKYYREALALNLDDGYLLAAWADFLLDQKRPAEVVTWLARWNASDGLLLRLAIAQSQLKLQTAAANVQALDDRFAAAKLRDDTTHLAEEARFQLQLRGNAGVAARLAAANYVVQREPRDARVLLEAALASGDGAAAQPVRDWLKTSRFEDAYLRQLGQATAALPSLTGNSPGQAR
jgi:Tfp pilus assembly protein PilF